MGANMTDACLMQFSIITVVPNIGRAMCFTSHKGAMKYITFHAQHLRDLITEFFNIWHAENKTYSECDKLCPYGHMSKNITKYNFWKSFLQICSIRDGVPLQCWFNVAPNIFSFQKSRYYFHPSLNGNVVATHFCDEWLGLHNLFISKILQLYWNTSPLIPLYCQNHHAPLTIRPRIISFKRALISRI